MNNVLIFITDYIKNIRWINIFDIILIVLIIWKVFNMFKKTRAIKIIKGLLFIYFLEKISSFIGFSLLNEFFEYIFTISILSLPIIFQDEIKLALERFGRGKLFFLDTKNLGHTVSSIERVVSEFSEEKVGALIVLEQDTGLSDYIEKGIRINGNISYELLSSIFKNQSALHDGAVIVRENKIMSAKCFLPLSENLGKEQGYGTRHRAGLGISEVSDAIVIMVSEETGKFTIAQDGKLIKFKKIDRFIRDLNKRIRKNSWTYYYKDKVDNIQNLKGFRLIIENIKLVFDIQKEKKQKENKEKKQKI